MSVKRDRGGVNLDCYFAIAETNLAVALITWMRVAL